MCIIILRLTKKMFYVNLYYPIQYYYSFTHEQQLLSHDKEDHGYNNIDITIVAHMSSHMHCSIVGNALIARSIQISSQKSGLKYATMKW